MYDSLNDFDRDYAGLGKAKKKAKPTKADLKLQTTVRNAIFQPPQTIGRVKMADLDRAHGAARRAANVVISAAKSGKAPKRAPVAALPLLKAIGLPVVTKRQAQIKRAATGTPGAPWQEAAPAPSDVPNASDGLLPGETQTVYGPTSVESGSGSDYEIDPTATAYDVGMATMPDLTAAPLTDAWDRGALDDGYVDQNADPSTDIDYGDDFTGSDGISGFERYQANGQRELLEGLGKSFFSKITKGIKKIAKNNKNTIGSIVSGVVTGKSPIDIATGALIKAPKAPKAPALTANRPAAPDNTQAAATGQMPAWALPAAAAVALVLLARK